MNVFDTAFARPSRIVVCSDAEFVHSIQMSLKVHEPDLREDKSKALESNNLLDVAEAGLEKDIA
jgi:hypothetical protein